MKKYKRTRIVASLAVISSLAFSSTTFGATMPISFRDRVREPGFASTSRSMRMGIESSSTTPEFDKRRFRTQKSANNSGKRDFNNLFSRFMGTIVDVSSTGFSLQKTFRGPSVSSSPAIYDVKISDATVYMKDGVLNSSSDITIGQHVMVTGTFDATHTTLTATGVNIITKKI